MAAFPDKIEINDETYWILGWTETMSATPLWSFNSRGPVGLRQGERRLTLELLHVPEILPENWTELVEESE